MELEIIEFSEVTQPHNVSHVFSYMGKLGGVYKGVRIKGKPLGNGEISKKNRRGEYDLSILYVHMKISIKTLTLYH